MTNDTREDRINAAVALLESNLGQLTRSLVRLRTILQDDELYNEILTRFES